MSLFGSQVTVWEVILGTATVILGTATVILGIVSAHLDSKKTANEMALDRLREYGKNTRLIDYRYVDVIMFGKRDSGKTSIAQLWTKPWVDIAALEASQEWQVHESSIYEFQLEKKYDSLFQTERTHVPTLRVRVHDYPGEDRYRRQAVKQLAKLDKKAVLVFVFLVGYHDNRITQGDLNATYYSRMFVEEVNDHVKSLIGSVSRAIVVFNKTDFLPQTWDDATALRYLRTANKDALSNIERLFSTNLEYRLTSAWTNKGVIGLLGRVGRVGLDKQADLQDFDRKIALIDQEVGRRGA